jgi:hypothetical protein
MRASNSEAADVRACLTAVVLTVILVRHGVFAADSVPGRLTVCVENSMPVAGQPCRLWLARRGSVESPSLEGARVTFHVSHGEGHLKRIELPATFESEASIASAVWTPKQTGQFQITAKVRQGQSSDPKQIEVFPANGHVTSRKLHFNYWQARPEQRLVTSVMDNSETTEEAIRWKQRGVMPLGYKSGQWHWAHGYDSPGKMAKLWSDLPDQRVGIVIDEFGGGDKIDQQLGEALLLTRKQRQNVFIAPYCLSVSGPKMIAGYQQANLILVETYTSDWRWDGTITGRWKTAVDAGLKDRSIAVLGLGSQWIGTEEELRRVFRMIRATCPEMPGVGFFPDVPPRLMKAVDSAIEDYFLRPVIKSRVDGSTFHVRNIGESPATMVEVAFLDDGGKPVSTRRVITQLKPWAAISEKLPPGAVTAAIAPAPDRYSLLSYTPPLERPKPDASQQAAALQFRERAMNGEVSNPLQQSSELTLVRTDDSDPDPGNRSHVRSASIPIRPSAGKAIALSFDIRPNRCWFYGHNSVSLVGDGELTLTWSRQDHDAGLEGNQPRPALIFKGKDGYVVRVVPTMGFTENETYSVLLKYDGHENVRVVVADAKNTVLWDSGSILATGGFGCSQIRFDVNPFPRSEISVERNQRQVLLRGGGGGPDSPYWLETTLSNLRLIDLGRGEGND